MLVDQGDDDFAIVPARRKRAFGFHVYPAELTDAGAVAEVGLAVLVQRHGWGAKWSYLDEVGADGVRRVAEWLQRVADGSDIQPPIDVGVDEETRETQITFEQLDPTTIRLRLRGEARPFHMLDEEETPDPPDEAVVDFEDLRPDDVRSAALFLRSSVNSR